LVIPVALSVRDEPVQTVVGIVANATVAVTAGVITIGGVVIVALGDEVVTQPVIPVTLSVTTSPGLKVLAAPVFVLTGSTN